VPGPLEVAGYCRLLVAPNAGPMTLSGTNTWLLGDPEQAAPVVVDPGPQHPGHRDAVLAACRGRITEIVLTHRHADHAEGAAELARLAGCGVRSADPRLPAGAADLRDGDEIAIAGASITAHPTPGHTSDSFSFLLRGDDQVTRLLTGDTVLGRGTSVITWPDGDLRAYLGSLELLEALVQTERVTEILPGHGPRVGDPVEWLAFYRSHRLSRLEQVRAAVAAGDRTAADVVARVYADVERAVWPAAEQSVRAQLEYLGVPSEP
jgi:glyoxylase-like metal-dependent hydrolase (beta-lactamase superfamily II)